MHKQTQLAPLPNANPEAEHALPLDGTPTSANASERLTMRTELYGRSDGTATCAHIPSEGTQSGAPAQPLPTMRSEMFGRSTDAIVVQQRTKTRPLEVLRDGAEPEPVDLDKQVSRGG